MGNESSGQLARELTATALAICNVPADDARVAHLGPLVTDLLNDGERLVGRVSAETEPMTVVRIQAQTKENNE